MGGPSNSPSTRSACSVGNSAFVGVWGGGGGKRKGREAGGSSLRPTAGPEVTRDVVGTLQMYLP